LSNSPYTYDITWNMPSTYQVLLQLPVSEQQQVKLLTNADVGDSELCGHVSCAARTGVRLDGVVVFAADNGCQSSPTFARSADLVLNCYDAARQVSANVYAEVKGLASNFSFTSRTTLTHSAACSDCVCFVVHFVFCSISEHFLSNSGDRGLRVRVITAAAVQL